MSEPKLDFKTATPSRRASQALLMLAAILFISMSAHAQVGGAGALPIACFTQSIGGGSSPVTITFDPSCTYLPISPIATQTYRYQAIWDFGDGSDPLLVPGAPSATASTALAPVTHAFSGAQTYVITLTMSVLVVDTTGVQFSGPSTFTTGAVRVAQVNYPPTPILANTGSEADGLLPFTLTVNVNNSFDEDGYILWGAMDWGDGTYSQISPLPPLIPSVAMSHSYVVPGVYKVTLSVIDNGRLAPGTVMPSVPSSNNSAAALAAIRQFHATTVTAGLSTVFDPILKQDFIIVQVPGNATTLKGQFKVDFGRPNNDTLDLLLRSNEILESISNLSIALTLGSGTSALTLPVFQTNARGQFYDSAGFACSLSDRKQSIRLKFSHAILSAVLKVTDSTVVNGNVDVPVKMVINGSETISTTVRFSYNSVAGGKGLGKNGRSQPAGN